MPNRFSLILIPEGSNKVRRWKLSGRLIYAVAASWLLLAGIGALFAWGYYAERVDRQELFQLRQENNLQRQQLQRLVVDYENINYELNALATSEARVRQLASIDVEPREIPVAIGGLPSEKLEVDDLQVQISSLQEMLNMRRQSQEEVRNLLNDQVSISRATPKGWPTRGWITSYFGMRKSPITGLRTIHEGLDIAANTGTPIYATADGVVSMVAYSPSYGKTLQIDHGYGYRTIFAHNSKILVQSGQRVKRGDMIAKVGNTGRSTGSHLHYELRLNGVPIDPRKTL